MTIALRLLAPILLMAPVLLSSVQAQASGAYSCCFIDQSGKRTTHRGRASSFYKGSVERLCRALAIEQSVKQCNPTVTDMAADLDFTKGPIPASVDLSKSCRTYPCKIGILVAGPNDVGDDSAHFDLAVSNAGLQCSIEKQINSTIDGWVLMLVKPKKASKMLAPESGCMVVRSKKSKEEGRTVFQLGATARQK